MPCVNKVMEPHDKQMKLTAFFLGRNPVNRSDLSRHNSRKKGAVQTGRNPVNSHYLVHYLCTGKKHKAIKFYYISPTISTYKTDLTSYCISFNLIWLGGGKINRKEYDKVKIKYILFHSLFGP